MRIEGHILNPVARTVTDGEIEIENGRIASVKAQAGIPADAPYILPGFIDSHVHIESSMMMPTQFAGALLPLGIVGAVCDPHEIANVLGTEGVVLMLEDAAKADFHFAFGAPSCVPSCGSAIETSGSVLDADDVAALLKRDDIKFLSEMMNFPGVLGGNPEVMAKIQAAKEAGKPVDGHAPGLTGELRRRYAEAGISTDHECSGLDEARDTISSGMFLLIREGSAARNYEALAPMIGEAPEHVMFCTDDSHPGDIVRGGVDKLVRYALRDGYDIMDILQAACVNPVRHYSLPVGLLQEGDPADFICISDLTPGFKVLATYLGGRDMKGCKPAAPAFTEAPNVFNAAPISADVLEGTPTDAAHVIQAFDGQLFTGKSEEPAGKDCQKLVVYNRYTPGAEPVSAYIRGFNMECGAIAQSIAHDCHNIVAVGSSDALIAEAINKVVEMRGGIAVTDGKDMESLPLPIAGIISTMGAAELAAAGEKLDEMARRTGCTMKSPFITLAFMALPVIPRLKLTDKGLFDGDSFSFVD